ncbi:helix-turn-helix transcriptional regulator [Alteribacillus sp. YIM 98480]|uniref:helix-turn-helix domain-containing protein n=1 Tax=Alteribacillus sp. YIM 98480 TaxID=2606599 RepID=UPI00131E26F3|nr:helix-turn-helix transcriptional regulator [Alteribacillus sp. YIM 98480]
MTGYKCRLRVILAEKEWRIGEFAKRVNISKSAMSNIINNHSVPSFDVTYRILEELDMSMQEIWEKREESRE